jgi:hypothetical protein
MKMQAVAWNNGKTTSKSSSDQEIEYTLQITSSDRRAINKLIKEASGWKQHGTGFDTNSKNVIVLLRKSFRDKQEWINFANTLSFDVEEISTRTGKKRLINGKRNKS